MAAKFRKVFGNTKPVIAMVHIGALPGSPLYDADGGLDRLIADAQARGDHHFANPRVLVTGGCSRMLKLPPRFECDPDLTLRGLIRYGELHSQRQ